MSRSKRKAKTDRETPQERVAYLMELTKGVMPVVMIAYSEEEAAELSKVLAKHGKKAANLSVRIDGAHPVSEATQEGVDDGNPRD